MVTMETLLDHVQLTVHLESGEVLEVMISLALLSAGSVVSQLDLACASLPSGFISCSVLGT